MRYHTMKVHACDNEPSMGIHTLYSVSTRKREEGKKKETGEGRKEEGRKEETEEGRKEEREGQGEGGKVKKRRRKRDSSFGSSDSLGSVTGGFASAKTRSVPCFSL